MPATLTLKNIPDAIYDRLKAAALTHRRSMNSEAIVCLETMLMEPKITTDERISRARELRASFPDTRFEAAEIEAAKQEGRA